MNLLALAIQYHEKNEQSILWTVDIKTKFLIKTHISHNKLCEYNIGDCIEVISIEKCQKQEIWIRESKKIADKQEIVLEDYLEKRAATPFSVIKTGYFGNIVKINEIIEINKNVIVAKLYGFPKENKYLQIHDYKWNKYMLYNMNSVEMEKQLRDTLNKIKNKYLIIDFPENSYSGMIQAAALVVI